MQTAAMAEMDPPGAELPAVYLDWAAAAVPRPDVLAAYSSLAGRHIANPHGSSRFGEQERRALGTAGRALLAALGSEAGSADVVWTSGGTEALNLACLGALRVPGGPSSALVDAGAHHAMLEACRYGVRERGGRLELLPLRTDGHWDLARASIPSDGSVLVAVNAVNNETGAVSDVAELRQWLDRVAPEAVLVVDAVQAVGRVPVSFTAEGIDLLAIGGRKVGGPAATGALVRRTDVPVAPLLFGGDQQQGLRAGTVDVVGALQLTRAVLIAEEQRQADWDHAARLARRLDRSLDTAGLPATVRLSPPDGVPHIRMIAFPGYEGAVLMRLLAERGVLVGTGSACRAESEETSHVLRAMGVSDEAARGALRISVGWMTSEDDITAFVAQLASVIAEY